jgi:hypothetical protein
VILSIPCEPLRCRFDRLGHPQPLSDLGRKARKKDERTAEVQAELARLKKRLTEILAIDFFGAPGREAAEATIRTIEHCLKDERAPKENKAKPEAQGVARRLSMANGEMTVARDGAALAVATT